MKICVLVKQVPGSEAQFSVSPDGSWIQETGLPFEMNESDNYALEEALQIREQMGVSEVVIVSLINSFFVFEIIFSTIFSI